VIFSKTTRNAETKDSSASLRAKFLMFSLAMFFFLPANSWAQGWEELKGDHFIVFYRENKNFAGRTISKAEESYQKIAHDLGYARYSKFWGWENRVKIYLYADKTSYLSSTGSPAWTEGLANYKDRLIASYAGSVDFLESVLPHEIAHLIFRDFVGFQGDVPVWLDEGIAQWWTKGIKDQSIHEQVKRLFDKDALLSIEDITLFDPRKIREGMPYIKKVTAKDGKPAMLILKHEQLILTFYVQAASLVGFMRERYGADRFTRFCRELRDGKTLDKALQGAYGEYFSDIYGLEKAWRRFLS